jgi:hypothetical protein
MFAAHTAAGLGFFVLSTYAKGDSLPKMVPIGPAEVVWNQTKDACPGFNRYGHVAEQPDSMPLAWHNPITNETSLISANDWGTFATVGPSLNSLSHHDCSHRIYTSVNSTLPESFANHQWLQVAHVYPNGTGAAIIHSEFHGDVVGNPSMCPTQYPHRPPSSTCQYWTSGIGVTSDGGSHWELVHDPPNHVVFVEPRPYNKLEPVSGFGAIGAMVDGNDGYFYGHVNEIHVDQTGLGDNASGICAFRTNDPSDPQAYRGWNGSHWTATWANPYVPISSQTTSYVLTLLWHVAGTTVPCP